eukprot:1935182-Amphidinium_carterae.1
MEWPLPLANFVRQAEQDAVWRTELHALRDAVDVVGIEDVSDLANMFIDRAEAMQHGLSSLWELARLSTRPDTHLVQAVLRQVAPPRCTLP